MIDLQAILNRLAAIEVEALASLSPAVTADAVPYFLHTQEAFPYFVNRISNVPVDSDSQDFDTYEVEATVRLVVAHRTEGYDGEVEGRLYRYLPAVIAEINAREQLQSASYTAELDNLIFARATGSGGLRVFETSGLSVVQVGAEITVVCQLTDDLTQDYL